MRTLYFDGFSGASGDMLLGALVDLGVSVTALTSGLGSLGLGGYELYAHRVDRSGLSAVKLDVVVNGQVEGPHGEVHGHAQHHAGHGMHLGQILHVIGSSKLPDRVRDRAMRVFARLGEAEARVHGSTPEQVHFHEVGAVDAIVDVVGACLGFELLGIERFVCSPLNVGGGTVTFSHGTWPVPAPATAELVRGVPVYSYGPQKELLTPTGAAILTTVASEYGPLPAMTVEAIGYGAGAQDFAGSSNVLRLMLGHTATAGSERVCVLDATVDDMTAESLAYFAERALAEGALDVTLTPTVMKKGRPGVNLRVLARVGDRERLARLVLRETSTIGLRWSEVNRMVLDRESVSVTTPVGEIRVKVARLDGEVVNVAPEFEDCRQAALACAQPLAEVQRMALDAYERRLDGET